MSEKEQPRCLLCTRPATEGYLCMRHLVIWRESSEWRRCLKADEGAAVHAACADWVTRMKLEALNGAPAPDPATNGPVF